MDKLLVLETYKRLVNKHFNSPVIGGNVIIQSIGRQGIDSQVFLAEMAKFGMISQAGQGQYRLAVHPKMQKSIEKTVNETAASTPKEIFKKFGLSESTAGERLSEDDEMPAASAPAPAVDVPSEPATPAKDHVLNDTLKVTTTFVSASIEDAKMNLAALKTSMGSKMSGSVSFNLLSDNPFGFAITGAPADISAAEFYLSSALVDSLGDKTDMSKLKVTKERVSALAVGA